MPDSNPLLFFDSDTVQAEEKLRRCREKLIRRFIKEGCYDPEDLAHDTLKRVFEVLNKNPQVLTASIESFISGFARNVISESRRRPILKDKGLDDLSPVHQPRTIPIDDVLIALKEEEDLRQCLKQCIDRLQDAQREMLISYYDTGNEKLKKVRESLAISFGFTSSQLRKHTFNLRTKLEACIKDCLSRRNKTKKLS